MATTTGIRFYRSSVTVETNGGTPIFSHGTIEPDISDFDHIFRPLYPEWVDLILLDENESWMMPCDLSDEEELRWNRDIESYRIKSPTEGEDAFLMSARTPLILARIFERFGKFVEEFQGSGYTLCGSDVPYSEVQKAERRIWQSNCPNELPECVDTLLHNWDGVYWEIFAKNERHLDLLIGAHAHSKNLTMYWVSLADDFPIPRGSSPEDANMMQVEPIE